MAGFFTSQLLSQKEDEISDMVHIMLSSFSLFIWYSAFNPA